MGFTIGNLSGYFDGYKWIQGPVSFEIDKGKITSIEITSNSSRNSLNNYDVDGSSKFLSPGFNDGHTHLIFAGERSFELPLKVRGASYAEILESGGGILKTIQPTREATDDELLTLVLARLDKMLEFGTTVVEAKSGYGLTSEQELRLLRILKLADEKHIIKVIPTFCGAHALPPEISRESYVEEVINMLPEIKANNLATSTDVFCDKGAFTVEETRSILQASKDVGIPIRVHAEELQYTGIGKIAAQEFDALSVDHLLHSKEEDFKVYSKQDTVAMFMPAATIGLFTTQKPSGWQTSGVTIGLGSDFNPNNWVMSMQTAIRLAVYLYRIDPIQAFGAAINGSYKGITGKNLIKIEEGTSANFNLINANNINEFVTKFDQNLVSNVIIQGNSMQ